MPTCYSLWDCCRQCLWHHSRPLSTQASTRDSQTLTCVWECMSFYSTILEAWFSPYSVPPIRKLAQVPFPHPSDSRQNESHNHRKLTKMITWITALWTQWNYEPCYEGPPKMGRTWCRVLTKLGPLEKEWQTNSACMPWEHHEQNEKAKRYDTETWAPRVSKCTISYWGRMEK